MPKNFITGIPNKSEAAVQSEAKETATESIVAVQSEAAAHETSEKFCAQLRSFVGKRANGSMKEMRGVELKERVIITKTSIPHKFHKSR